MREFTGKMCDECNARPATKIVPIVLNGVQYQAALCDECAAKRQAVNQPVYGAFINGEPECPVCHTRLSDIVGGQYVGCSECYNVFRGQVLNNIYEMHGTRKHIGKRLRVQPVSRNVNLSERDEIKEQYHLARDEGRNDDAEELFGFLRGDDENGK